MPFYQKILCSPNVEWIIDNKLIIRLIRLVKFQVGLTLQYSAKNINSVSITISNTLSQTVKSVTKTTKKENEFCIKVASGFGGCNATAIFQKIWIITYVTQNK